MAAASISAREIISKLGVMAWQLAGISKIRGIEKQQINIAAAAMAQGISKRHQSCASMAANRQNNIINERRKRRQQWRAGAAAGNGGRIQRASMA